MDDLPLPLDVIGYIEGTTKSSIWVDYLTHYESHIAPYKDRDIELLEIGVFEVHRWPSGCYFPRAKLIGVDINPKCKQYEDDRATIEIGWTDDPEGVATPCANIPRGPLSMMEVTFRRITGLYLRAVLPSLQPGGLYVVGGHVPSCGSASRAVSRSGDDLDQRLRNSAHAASLCSPRAVCWNASRWSKSKPWTIDSIR